MYVGPCGSVSFTNNVQKSESESVKDYESYCEPIFPLLLLVFPVKHFKHNPPEDVSMKVEVKSQLRPRCTVHLFNTERNNP